MRILIISFFILIVSIAVGQAYTASNGNDNTFEWITQVKVIDGATDLINKSSGQGAGGYSDFTSNTATLDDSKTYTISVSISNEDGYDEYVRVWIDWGDNGSFNEAGEEYDFNGGNAITSTSTHSIDVTVPVSAIGNNVRMRVTIRYDVAPISTGDFDFGEVEDYSININENPTAFEYISNVQIGSINNTTTGSDADGDGNKAYDDFTSQTGVLLPGSTYSLSVTLHANANDYVRAWIDWNDDGDYVDAGEEYTVVSNTGSDGPHSVTITVPASASGKGVKMRTTLKYNGIPNSTEIVTQGEVEEYSLYIDKDTDGDGIYDTNDKDADNDGMLDEDENFCLSQDFLNGNFEGNIVNPNDNSYIITNSSNIPGWNTTAGDNKIEIWDDGFNGVPAYEGTYFAEINANQSARMYQTLDVEPGDIVKWNVAHRGRSGVDVMDVMVGPAGAPTTQQTVSTGKNAWVVYSSSYTVPAGVTQIEIGFESVSTANGNNSVGNFIDDIQLYITRTTYCDSDGDGVPNIFDLDSDNDGIADVIEAGGTDPDNDGRIGTGAITDTDGDGLSDIVDTDNGGTPLSKPNSDGDALDNYMDIDSDNDGIVDNIEGQSSVGYTAPLNTDANNNGWDDRYDGNAGGTAIALVDSDGDHTPDYMDTNSDDDSYADAIEAYDTDKDNVAEKTASNRDSDGDGLDDSFDADGSSTTDNAGATNNSQTPTSFPNDDNSTSAERDWRESLSTLPVSLLAFDGEINNGQVVLVWATASEVNNDYFIIERSANNRDFKEVVLVDGNGNSNIVINYNTMDASPLTGISYYRLKQVDFDGTISYSNSIVINNADENFVNLYPNPTSDFVNVVCNTKSIMNIYSPSGQLIVSKLVGGKGIEKVSLSQLTKGVYIVIIENDNTRFVKRLIIK